MERSDAADRLEAESVRLQSLRIGFESDGVSSVPEPEGGEALSGFDQEPVELGTETFNRQRDLAILEQVEAEVSDVEAALERLENGTYGLCETCHQPIEDARLEALPATRFCRDDQALSEEARLRGD